MFFLIYIYISFMCKYQLCKSQLIFLVIVYQVWTHIDVIIRLSHHLYCNHSFKTSCDAYCQFCYDSMKERWITCTFPTSISTWLQPVSIIIFWYLNILSFFFSAVLRRRIHGAASGEASDSEEELAAFCPTVSLCPKRPSISEELSITLLICKCQGI